MLAVLRLNLSSEVPVVDCEITPYVLIRRPDNTTSSDDVPESAPISGYFLKYKWFRVKNDMNDMACSIHPSEKATIQCACCAKHLSLTVNSYHCSVKCYQDAWANHRKLHERAAKSAADVQYASTAAPFYPPPNTQRNATGETLSEVGRCKNYTPKDSDIGYILKFECQVINARSKQPLGQPSTILTSRVTQYPAPMLRRLIPVGVSMTGRMNQDVRVKTPGSFTVLSYNILSDNSTRSDLYSYCPPWALTWSYRRQSLLQEIVGYRADVVCLQEVQNNHLEDFFTPELDKHGYDVRYTRKTNEVLKGSASELDGCAIFFRRDRFSLAKKYDVELNKAAHSLVENTFRGNHQAIALNRLLKDNIALIVVLEARFGGLPPDPSGKSQLICVANTHVDVDRDSKDLTLWEVHTFLKGLEKIAETAADIPMIVCGDFNALPGSATHSFLISGKVDPSHPDLTVDPFGILQPMTKLTHKLPLASAYPMFRRVGMNDPVHIRRLDPITSEPLFTCCTREFAVTQDYIFFRADTLVVEYLLELLDEDVLRRDRPVLPAQDRPSNHIVLLAQFRFMPKSHFPIPG